MMIAWQQTLQNSFCKKIRELREAQKWTQEFVSLRMDMSVQSISKMESGLTNVTFSCIQQLAQIYNVPMVELLILHDENNTTAIKIARLAALKQKLSRRETEISALRNKMVELYEELQHSKVSA